MEDDRMGEIPMGTLGAPSGSELDCSPHVESILGARELHNNRNML